MTRHRKLLALDATYGSVVQMAIHRAFGWEVFLLNSAPPRTQRSRLLSKLGIKELRLERSSEIRLPPDSYAAVPRASLRIAKRRTANCSLADSNDWSHPPITVEIARRLSAQFEDLTIADAWARSGGDRIIVSRRSAYEVLKELRTPARILTAWSPRQAREPSGGQTSIAEGAAPSEAQHLGQEPKDPRGNALALMVLNRDIRYGGLYSYEELLPAPGMSPWSPDQVAFLSAKGGQLSNGARARALPSPLNQRQVLFRDPFGALRLLARPWCLRTMWQQQLLVRRSEAAAEQIREAFPRAQGAFLAFDVQVPVYVALGLELAGIKTVSVQERPALSYDEAATTVCGTVLSGSDIFDRQIKQSDAICMRSSIPVGLWRTDILRQEMSKVSFAERLKTPTVLALPYHAEPEGQRPSDPVCTSIESLEFFLDDIAYLARRHPAVSFVIRAKNKTWIHDQRIAPTLESLAQCGNITFDGDYSVLNRTYAWAAKSMLIIAKPTSMVDEALACGIPCILHDYTHNISDYARPLLNYLPRDLWVLNRGELTNRVTAVLENPPAAALKFDQHRKSLFGAWADGSVRDRIHRELTGMIED